MNLIAGVALAGLIACSLAVAQDRHATTQAAASVHDFTVNNMQKQPVSLSEYRGKVLLIVNVASQCGFTPQYAGLEKLYREYKEQGLVVMGFPSNDFGGQEPGTEEQIITFCRSRYDVTFPVFAKVVVKGQARIPLYQYLTSAEGGEIGWNFTKFLVGRDGKVIARFNSQVTPDDPKLVQAVKDALATEL